MTTLVIDSNFLAYRAYYSLGGLSHEDVETGVMFGFLSAILDLGHQFQTNRFVFCWDSKHSLRKEIYPEYKANRVVTDPEEKKRKEIFYKQVKILRLWAAPCLSRNSFLIRGYEADDLIMACCSFEPGGRVITVTADEDLYQVLQLRHNEWYNPTKRLRVTHNSFTSEKGIDPSQWALVKALAGDTSDNIKGVKGVGKATAIKYVRHELRDDRETYKSIREFVATGQLKTNLKLITLPFGCNSELVTMFADSRYGICAGMDFPINLNLENLFPVFEEFGMASFMEGSQRRRWEKLYARDFSKDPSKARFKRRR